MIFQRYKWFLRFLKVFSKFCQIPNFFKKIFFSIKVLPRITTKRTLIILLKTLQEKNIIINNTSNRNTLKRTWNIFYIFKSIHLFLFFLFYINSLSLYLFLFLSFFLFLSLLSLTFRNLQPHLTKPPSPLSPHHLVLDPKKSNFFLGNCHVLGNHSKIFFEYAVLRTLS